MILQVVLLLLNSFSTEPVVPLQQGIVGTWENDSSQQERMRGGLGGYLLVFEDDLTGVMRAPDGTEIQLLAVEVEGSQVTFSYIQGTPGSDSLATLVGTVTGNSMELEFLRDATEPAREDSRPFAILKRQ